METRHLENARIFTRPNINTYAVVDHYYKCTWWYPFHYSYSGIVAKYAVHTNVCGVHTMVKK